MEEKSKFVVKALLDTIEKQKVEILVENGFNFKFSEINNLAKISQEKDLRSRTLQDVIDFISTIRSFNFFQKYEEVLSKGEWLALGLHSEIQIFEPLTPICLIREPAKTVYLILSGEIAVTLLKKQKYEKSILEKKTLAVLRNGISFGELAVLYDTKRTASCVAIDKVTTLSMDEKIFKEVLGDHVRDMNAMRYEILSNVKLFLGWDRSLLNGLLNHIYVRNPKRNDYIYTKGEKNANIYIIVDGELEISSPYEYIESDFDKIKIGSTTQIKHKNEFKVNYKKNLEFSLIKLNTGNYFGDEDGFGSKVKQYSVKALTNDCKLFLIPKDVHIF